jgi:hypothetical protein
MTMNSKHVHMEPVVVTDCGSCNMFHHRDFRGDCRDDSNRLNHEQLNSHYGHSGWIGLPHDD